MNVHNQMTCHPLSLQFMRIPRPWVEGMSGLVQVKDEFTDFAPLIGLCSALEAVSVFCDSTYASVGTACFGHSRSTTAK